MATNADEDVKSEETVLDEDKEVTEDDLRSLKYGDDEVETSDEEEDESSEADEGEEDSEEASEGDGQTADQTTDESEETDETETVEDPPAFVKEFPNIKGDTPEEYAKNLEEAYKNSTSEALRLKNLADAGTPSDDNEEEDPIADALDVSDPVSLYMKQKMDEEISQAFSTFTQNFPQVSDPTEYNKFTNTVSQLSQTIMRTEKRLAPPKELYSKSAVILGWEPSDKVDEKEVLAMALKNKAAVSKTTTSTKKASKSKVTDAMVIANRKMYPDKTDVEIRKELEPYVQ